MNHMNITSYHLPLYDYRTLIQDVELPEEITSLGSFAFYQCSNLQPDCFHIALI